MLEDLQKPKRANTCRIVTIKAELSEDDYKIFMDAVYDESWSGHALKSALNEKGLSISGDSILKHRKGACKCSKA